MATSDVAISRYLEAGERVLWSGTPVRGLLLRREDRALLPFGLVWLGFALFIAAGIVGSSSGPPFPFLVVPFAFVAFGLYMVIGRFLWDADVRDHTTYAITNRRAIVLRLVPTRRLASMSISLGTEVQTIERRDGSGTIYFGPRGDYWNGFPRPSPNLFMFERIREFKQAMRILRSVAHERSA